MIFLWMLLDIFGHCAGVTMWFGKLWCLIVWLHERSCDFWKSPVPRSQPPRVRIATGCRPLHLSARLPCRNRAFRSRNVWFVTSFLWPKVIVSLVVPRRGFLWEWPNSAKIKNPCLKSNLSHAPSSPYWAKVFHVSWVAHLLWHTAQARNRTVGSPGTSLHCDPEPLPSTSTWAM